MKRPTTVSVDNWQDPMILRWSYQHVDEVLATARISRGPTSGVALPRDLIDLGDLEVPLPDGDRCTVADVLARSDTDGWMVLHDGRVVVEQYFGQLTAATPHLLQSVSKSVVSTVVGALVGQQVIEEDAPVTDYVPELSATGYAGATVRQLLDMRSGIAFSEDYVDPGSDSRRLEATSGWAPLPDRGAPRSIKTFLLGLEQARPHGGPFEYRSCETDVLGWVCQAAAGQWFPKLASDLVWSRIGARHDALICVDAEGTGVFDGGICVTVGDLARFGAMILGRGRSVTGQQVVPTEWVDDIFVGGPDSTSAFAATTDDVSMRGGMYRSQFWFPTASREVAVGIGIHGQMLYLDRATGMVGVKLSSWPAPQEAGKMTATLGMFEAISAHLASRPG